MNVGVTCWPTFGGSGIIATEVGMALAARGHRVHFICTDVPRRLDLGAENVFFHEVRARDYELFPRVPHELALCSAMVAVATAHRLDVLHAHYAVPHATSAWMAREVLGGAPKVVTTLHGTDITLVGSDPSYLPITRHSIVRSDAVTAPSAFLRDETWARFDIDPRGTPIEVIPNFVDVDRLRPLEGATRPHLAALFDDHAPTVVHVSNFRPLKRVDRVVELVARVPGCNLLLVGDGPERPAVEAQIAAAGLARRVRLIGGQEHFEALLRECAVFLLPSETESFGLAALEALASGVPVIASDVGGLPEVIREGETGFLCRDTGAMAARLRALLADPAARAAMGARARADVLARFRAGPMIDRYEALLQRVAAPRA